MELYEAMLVRLLTQHVGTIQVTFPDLEGTAAQLVECASYQALVKIQAILRDDTLSDPECFQKIEEILCVLEELGGQRGGPTRLRLSGKHSPLIVLIIIQRPPRWGGRRRPKFFPKWEVSGTRRALLSLIQ